VLFVEDAVVSSASGILGSVTQLSFVLRVNIVPHVDLLLTPLPIVLSVIGILTMVLIELQSPFLAVAIEGILNL